MKKIISIILSVLMLTSVTAGLNLTAQAADYTTLATDISLNGQWSDDIWRTSDDDQWYRITIPSDGKLTLKVMSYKNYTRFYLRNYDLTQTVIDAHYPGVGGTETAPSTETYEKTLSGGTYYMNVWGAYGKYRICAAFESYGTNDAGALSYDSPLSLPMNYQIVGARTETNTEDWYALDVPSAGMYTVKVVSYENYTRFYLRNYDLTQTVIDAHYPGVGGTETQPTTEKYNVVLGAGRYYINVWGATGKYYLSWSPLTQENCSHEFETSTVSPTYFAKGYTQYTCKICGYTYADNYTSKLKVTVPSIYSTKKGKKKVTLYFSNSYGLDGIQIKYSTSKKFTKKSTKTASTKKTSKTLKKLKGHKKYYIKIRGYKIVDGKKAYSKWSKVKSVKTK